MPRESKKARLERAAEIHRRLAERFPDAKTELQWSNPFELLVAVILSAQCTDVRVNQVMENLRRKYRTVEDYANADPRKFEEEIKPTGFFRNKTKSVIGSARMILEEFGGEVPQTMEELVKLPGVSRKTANVVLGNAFGVSSGIVVDTHVHRVSQRLGLVPLDLKDAEKVEKLLMDLWPQENWIEVSSCLVLHGRYVCTARKPKCNECVLADLCPKCGVSTT
jgi:endonuclease-3